jgi:hypothetical protein
MVKRAAILIVEFDDEDEMFNDAADFSTFCDQALRPHLSGLDVTVYATPEDLILDTAEGFTVFSPDQRSDTEFFSPTLQETQPAPKP